MIAEQTLIYNAIIFLNKQYIICVNHASKMWGWIVNLNIPL